MKVISKVDNKKLIKGVSYEVVKLKNLNNGNSKWFYPSVTVRLNSKSKKTFSVNSFTLENGDELPKINYTSEDQKYNIDYNVNPYEYRISEDNIKEGDYVVYIRNSHSSLVYGKKYKIKEVRKRERNHHYILIDIKLEGSNRFYRTNSFRRCTVDELRDTNLKLLMDDESDVVEIDKKKRKFDFYSDEEKNILLLEALFSSAMDKNRNNLSIVDWVIKKVAKQYKIKSDDYSNLMDKNLKEILEILEGDK